MNEYNAEVMDKIYDIPIGWKKAQEMIMVVGVGGGGCNAVDYMFEQKIEGCSFAVCNTDAQVLEHSKVSNKITLGKTGLGAGTNPEAGEKAALESIEEIESKLFTDLTRMLFITAGLGGGTGTGAAPIIAELARRRNILTVAVVTLPFRSEQQAISKALSGVRKLESVTDALLVIDNEKIYKQYPDMLIHEAFPKADEVLTTAVRGIIEIITKTGFINVDFNDVSNLMRRSGYALMGQGEGKGKNRVEIAVTQALESPLLLDCDLTKSDSALINITVAKTQDGLMSKELEHIDNTIKKKLGHARPFKRGIVYSEDPDFGDKVKVTIIVTGIKPMEISNLLYNGADEYIEIDRNFAYQRPSDVEQAHQSVCAHIEKKRRFHYDAPTVLNTADSKDFDELENNTALSRSKSNS